jgi:hypothetical protein
MITLKHISQAHGYSSDDHLLDDGPLQDLIGCSFRSIADLRRRANAIQARTQDRRCARPPIRCEVIHADGSTSQIEV